jgi:hypothetical protein
MVAMWKKGKSDPKGAIGFAVYVGFLLAVSAIVPPALKFW